MTLAHVASVHRFGSALLCLLCVACAEDGQAPALGPTACEWVHAKRQSCCLEAFECGSAYDECHAKCLVGWGCAEQADPGSDPGIAACLWNCAPRFTCDDGSEIYAAFRCDGEGDCAGSEDEKNCPPRQPPAPIVDAQQTADASSPVLHDAAAVDAMAQHAPDAALSEATPSPQASPDASSASEASAAEAPPACDAAVLTYDDSRASTSGADVDASRAGAATE